MAASPLRAHLDALFAYDAWANARVADALRAGPPLPRALRLFAHITKGSEAWLGRVREQDTVKDVWPDTPEAIDVEVSAARAEANARAWRALLRDADDLDRLIPHHNFAGQYFEVPLARIATHVANHGTYHRDQIAPLLRDAGAEPPVTDFSAYARAHP